jgi:hypothetical protein
MNLWQECYKGSDEVVECSKVLHRGLLDRLDQGYGQDIDWNVELVVVVGDGQCSRGGVGGRYGWLGPVYGEGDAA